jgi:PAS domain S-box-containing protein
MYDVNAQHPVDASPAARTEASALQLISEGTAHLVGEAFFRSLVRHMAEAMAVSHAFVAEFTNDHCVQTLAYWGGSHHLPNVSWDIRGTPCEDVVAGKLCHYPVGVAARFPLDRPLAEMGIESYLGVPLLNASGRHLGHLAVFDRKPMPSEPRLIYIFRIFAARAAAELERIRMEQVVEENERRFRDLYDEAPIAYIYEDVDSRFVQANRAAMRLLGLAPEDVPGTMGLTLIPPTPEAQARARSLIAGLHEGKERACVELELRRKDDGRPIWVQWYSKPEPDGKYTRTMLIDVTQRVLMEREKARLEQQNEYLQEEIKSVHNFEEIVGRSPLLMGALENVRRVAPTPATVLVLGETGTGKELIARAIHNASPRRDKPLIKINCAALPAGLVESELFGHEKGAFSGAIARRAGRFELADGGTIFLDEIGEMPLDAQVKLLRVLQEREFERVGGTQLIRVDVRVVAATNRDLLKSVQEGKFREDLYYRLNVFPIRLPSLRQRPEDVPLLVQFFVAKIAAGIGKRLRGVSQRSLAALSSYPWPGNVRELQNVLERAVILEVGDVLDVPAELLATATSPVTAPPLTMNAMPPVPAPVTAALTPLASAPESLKSLERSHILNVLGQTGWVIDGERGAAKVLGLHPNTLRSRMKKLGITRRTA